jgi:1-acyl-sn-glycerol-3-phosphate acyltransferase
MNLGILRRIYDSLRVRPFLFNECSCQVFHKERLPVKGPAIIVANHCSLIDAPVIQMQYPPAMLSSIRPTGSRDFFLEKGRLQYFMAKDIMRICFINRGSGEAAKVGKVDVFAEFREPLAIDNILIYFPQGTREEGAPFKPGVYHLARTFPGVPIIPVLLKGTREVHPKGIPFYKMYTHPVSVYVGEEFVFDPSLEAADYAAKLEHYIFSLSLEQ